MKLSTCLNQFFVEYLPRIKGSSEQTIHAYRLLLPFAVGYYLTAWPLLRDKWKKAHAHQVAFVRDQPLGQWRQMVRSSMI